MAKRLPEVRRVKTYYENGKKVFEVDCGGGYVRVTAKRFAKLTAPMFERAKAARKLTERARYVVSSTGKLGRRVKPVGKGHQYPFLSDVMAVHPDQIEEAEARNRKMGCSVKYEPHAGLAVIESEGQYQDLMRVEREATGRNIHRKNCYNT